MSAPRQCGERPIPCPPEVLTLVEHFERNRDGCKSGQYNEARIRQRFLNPLFEASGRDMANRAGYAEACKEVIHEDAVQRQIDATDRQIDQLVYELYGLTEEEIGIVAAVAK